MNINVENVSGIADGITDGTTIALAPDYSGCAIQVIYELIRQERRHLTLIGVPQMGYQADLLIGAGCVDHIDAAAVTLGELGQAPRFVDAVQTGKLQMHDSTCPVLHAGLQAAEKGIPFMPLRGILGSDLLTHRSDWKVFDNPFAAQTSNHEVPRQNTTQTKETDPIVLVPAITPDVALFHAPFADQQGNVWVGIRRELMLMAHAAKTCLVTVEKIIDDNLLADTARAAGTLPSLYVDSVVVVEQGATPVGLYDAYGPDETALARYAQLASSQQGFNQYLGEVLS